METTEALSEESVTAKFDQLVSEGVIIYGPYTSIKTQDEGYPMEFRISPALTTKPPTIGAPNPAFHSSRKWGPGSDMYCPDERLILRTLNRTHDLALNLFCVDRPQLLMLTRDSYARQHEALDAADLAVMLQTLRLFPGMYVIFNCGQRGGCSRVHKHLQGLRGPPVAWDVLVEGRGEKMPFVCFVEEVEGGFEKGEGERLLEVYGKLLERCREVLGWERQDECPPHNVVMWDDRIVVIPRRKGAVDGAAANAGGMLGSVWVQSQDSVDEWLRLGVANVLRELGVPSSGNN